MQIFRDAVDPKRRKKGEGPARLFYPDEGATCDVESAIGFIEDFGLSLLPGLVFGTVYEEYMEWCDGSQVPVSCDVFEKCLKENGLAVSTFLVDDRRVRAISPICTGRPAPVAALESRDSVAMFAEAEPPEDGIPVAELHERYLAFCAASRLKPAGSIRRFLSRYYDITGTTGGVARVDGKPRRVLRTSKCHRDDENGSQNDVDD